MPGRARVDRTARRLRATCGVTPERAARLDPRARVIGLVAADGAARRPASLQQRGRRVAFRRAARRHDAGIDDQAVAILHQHFARHTPASLRGPAPSWPSRRRDRSSTDACVFERRSPWKFTVGLPGSSSLGPALVPSLRRETLLAGPRLEQRAVDREVLVREQPVAPAPASSTASKNCRAMSPASSRSRFLRERRRRPHRVVHRQADKPAEQQVVVQLLHQQPLAPHGVEHLQQQRAQQLLRRDRRPTRLRVHRRRTAATAARSASSVIGRIARSGWSAGTRCSGDR